MTQGLDTILKGRKFKKLMEQCFTELRLKYDLKQIEVELLIFLDSQPNSRASDICKLLELNKGYVSQALVRLQEKAFIEQHNDPQDKRAVCFELTRRGKAVIKRATEMRDQMNELLLDGISEEELNIVYKVADKFEHNVELYCGAVESGRR